MIQLLNDGQRSFGFLNHLSSGELLLLLFLLSSSLFASSTGEFLLFCLGEDLAAGVFGRCQYRDVFVEQLQQFEGIQIITQKAYVLDFDLFCGGKISLKTWLAI